MSLSPGDSARHGRRADRKRLRRSRRLLEVAFGVVLTAVVLGLTVGLVLDGGTKGKVVATAEPRRPSSPPVVRRTPWPIPGYLLVADRGNNRIVLVDGRKRVLWRYPRPGTRPGFPFVFDDDAFFGPNLRSIISNQEDQHTIQLISFPGGRVLWHYGHVNHPGSTRGYLRTPDDAYLLPSGLRTVADAYNCRILFLSAAHRIVREYGHARRCLHRPPGFLGPVNGATPLADGGMLVSEIAGSWIDGISAHGRLLFAFRAPVSYPSDPQPMPGGRILLADYSRPGQALIVDRRGHVVWRYGPRSGAGELDHPSLALPLGNGLIAVNDDFRHRVVLISIREHRIVWQYGHTDVKGSGRNYLNTPDGMDLLPFQRALAVPKIRALVLSPR